MKIERVVVGNLCENCYIVSMGNSVLVIDPGDEIDKIKEVIEDREVKGILITHHHFDHASALSFFDKNLIYDFSNLKEMEYEIGQFKFEVIYTKGHSKDSISFYFREDNTLFCGDFIFLENIGRCDLSGGNFEEMKESISKIKKYPLDMIIYPGHGDKTTLEHEIDNNIYFK